MPSQDSTPEAGAARPTSVSTARQHLVEIRRILALPPREGRFWEAAPQQVRRLVLAIGGEPDMADEVLQIPHWAELSAYVRIVFNRGYVRLVAAGRDNRPQLLTFREPSYSRSASLLAGY